MDKIVVVEFLQSCPPWNVGETAGFQQVDADRMLRVAGLCKLRPDIEGKVVTRSPGLDPPAFSLQQLAGVMRAATEEVANTERTRRG